MQGTIAQSEYRGGTPVGGGGDCSIPDAEIYSGKGIYYVDNDQAHLRETGRFGFGHQLKAHINNVLR